MVSRGPRSVSGTRPPSASRDDARRPSAPADRGCAASAACASEASPSNVAVIGWLPATPIISREPVPALPKSSALRGLDEAADAGAARPASAPAPSRVTAAPSARQACGGAQHVVAFEKALDPGLADRKQPEDERPMRDRLVAGRAQTASQRRAGRGCGRRGDRDARRTRAALPWIAGVPAGSAARSLAWAPGSSSRVARTVRWRLPPG